MKKDLHISAMIDQPGLVQNLVERLAYRRYDIGYGLQTVPRGLKALETSTTEAYVSGSLDMAVPGSRENYRIPFITCFTFTCIKGPGDPYELIWSASLN